MSMSSHTNPRQDGPQTLSTLIIPLVRVPWLGCGLSPTYVATHSFHGYKESVYIVYFHESRTLVISVRM